MLYFYGSKANGMVADKLHKRAGVLKQLSFYWISTQTFHLMFRFSQPVLEELVWKQKHVLTLETQCSVIQNAL